MKSLYADHDLLGMIDPDPPWFFIPPPNGKFLHDEYRPMYENKECPCCEGKIDETSLGKRDWPSKIQDYFKANNATPDQCEATLFRCSRCGWWSVLQWKASSCFNQLIDMCALNWGKIRNFDVSFAEKPNNELANCLRANSQKLSVEQLKDMVSSCFNNHFPCEITHIREVNQKGADIFIVDAEHPVLVTISQQKDNSELVREILRFERRDGQYKIRISTSNRLVDYELPYYENFGFSITLASYDPIIELLTRDASQTPPEPWEKIWPAG